MQDRNRTLGVLALALACITLPTAAQSPEPALPRVIYGNPGPQVLYGPSSPAPAERPVRPPPAAAPPPAAPQGSLTYESGPAYLPPAYWGPPGAWGPPGYRPRRPVAPPPMPAPYVSPRGGAFEPPLPQGRYVGRPPSAPMTQPHYGRPPGY
jgi:hypothetical protein